MRVLTVILALGLAGCGGGGGAPEPSESPTGGAPPPDARAVLAALAAAAQDRAGVSLYALPPDRSVMVVRATDRSWRVDIPGGVRGGTVDVSMVRTPDGLFQCTQACVAVTELTPEIDPVLQHAFTDWLEVLTDRAAPLSVAAAAPTAAPSGSPTGSAAGSPTGSAASHAAGEQCFSVEPTTTSVAAPVPGSVYCFGADGTITRVELDLGILTLTGSDPAAPPTVELPAPVGPGPPLPTAPPPTPTLSATPSPTPA